MTIMRGDKTNPIRHLGHCGCIVTTREREREIKRGIAAQLQQNELLLSNSRPGSYTRNVRHLCAAQEYIRRELSSGYTDTDENGVL